MNSTYSSSDLILEVRDLDIHYKYDLYRSFNLRDKFVKIMTNPFAELFSKTRVNKVLMDINLMVHQNERIGILGVNGAGKTTLCRAICGMYYPSKGSVKVSGKVRAIFDTSVGIVNELTGRENAVLLSHLIYPELNKVERKKYIEDAISFSELGEYIDAPFQSYSKGMQARLCLSLISSKESDLLILDEVFDGADEFFQKKIAVRVLDMIKKSGAVIFVSHSPEQVRRSCNRVIVIHHNKIAFDGNVDDGISFYQSIHSYNDGEK